MQWGEQKLTVRIFALDFHWESEALCCSLCVCAGTAFLLLAAAELRSRRAEQTDMQSSDSLLCTWLFLVMSGMSGVHTSRVDMLVQHKAQVYVQG